MGKPYSLDLRDRICAYVARGNPVRSAGRLFGVSAATAVRFAAEHRDHGAAVPRFPNRRVARPVNLADLPRIGIFCRKSCRPNRTSRSRNRLRPCAALCGAVRHAWRRCSAFLALGRAGVLI